ncbi:MAG: Imm51 family immunity protein [Pirellulaceae bacterium]|jgi:hypothetical protein|nr:Imm51 family immunity protein [Pirellulaceae bacterium]
MLAGLNIIQYEDGRFGLTIQEPGSPEEAYWDLFEEQELQGGGYTWEGIVHALVEMRLGDVKTAIEVGAEADNAYVNSADRNVLERIAQLLEAAIAYTDLLLEAIENADDIE